MKIKRIIAAILCTALLAGCQSDDKPQGLSSTSYSSTQTSVVPASTTEQTTAGTRLTTTANPFTAATTTTTAKQHLAKPVITSVEEYTYPTEYFTLVINHNIPSYCPAGTYIRLFGGMHLDDIVYLGKYGIYEQITFVPYQGNNYFLLQYVCGDDESEMSEPAYYYYEEQNKVTIHQYTHTFMANYPEWTIVPDYTEALEDINNGIQPERFDIAAYWTCPYCGKVSGPYHYELDYCNDGLIFLASAGCLMSSCPGRKKNYDNRLQYYATQIS